MVTTDDLAGVPLFGELDEAQLAQVAQWFHAESAGEGAALVGEGAHGYTFFVLAEGTA